MSLGENFFRSTVAEAKKAVQKTVATPTGQKPFAIAQKIRPKTDSELSDFQTTISSAPKLIDKSKMELDDRGSEGSPLNLDDEQEVYSRFTSPESTDLKSGGETIFEKSVSPLSQTEMLLNDEERSQSKLSESKIEQLKVENKENSNMPFNLSPEILKKTELELVNMETPVVSEWLTPESVENLVTHETFSDSIPNKIDSYEVVPPEQINENQRLAENEIETENKSGRLLTCEHSTAESVIDKKHEEEMFTKLPTEEGLQIEEDKITVGEFEKTDEIISSPTTTTLTSEAEKLIFPENKLSETSNVEMPLKEPEITSIDNDILPHTEMVNRKVISNENECNMNEFVTINGQILKVSSEGKLEGYDSVTTTEVYSANLKEEGITAARKSLEQTAEKSNPIDERLVSSVVSLGRFDDVDELESAVCRKKIEFSDGEEEIPIHLKQVMKTELATDQGVSEDIVERLPKLSVPTISIMNDESSELTRSTENGQELSNAEDLGEKSETVNGMIKEEGLEFAEDTTQMEKLSQQLKYEERNIAAEENVTDRSGEEKIQQPINIDDLECALKLETEENSNSFFTGNASLTENHYPKIKEEIVEDAELQQEKKKEPEECLRAEDSQAESGTEAKITDSETQKVNDVFEMKSEEPESAGNDSVTQQLLQYMRRSVHNDALIGERKTIMHEIELEADEVIAVQEERLPEVILLDPEKLIVEGLTNNSEPVIVGVQESQPFTLTPLEKQESDGQESAVTFNTLDTMSSNANDISEKECGIDEMLNKSTHELDSTTMESNLFVHATDSLVSDIVRSDMTSIGSNSEMTFKENFEKPARSIPTDNAEVERRKEVIEEDEALSEIHCASHEVLPAEVIVCENLKKISVTENFEYSEEISKIVICSEEIAAPNVKNMENLVIKSDSERVEQFQVDAIETLHEEKLPQQQSENEEVITSVTKDASEESNDGKQSIREYLNELSQQYMHNTNVTQLAKEQDETGKALEEAIEHVEMVEVSESQRNPEFPAQDSANGFSKSDYDEALQKDVESVDSHYSVLSSMIATKLNHFDGSTTASESCNITREPITISHPYHIDIGESQNRSGHGSSFEYDVSSRRLGSDVGEEFSQYIQHVGQAECHTQELESKLKKSKSELEICQATCDKSFANNILPECLIINGLTADGQLILSSVSDPMLSSEDKSIDYFSPNNDAYETISDKVPLISDRNGNPEWKACDVQHCPSDAMNESNVCAADVNANISAPQESINDRVITLIFIHFLFRITR